LKNETKTRIEQLEYLIGNAQEIWNQYKDKCIVETVEEGDKKIREVIIISDFSKEPQPGKRWMGWIHQLMEAAKGLDISKNAHTEYALTFMDFFNQFGWGGGFSGSMNVFADLMESIYKAITISIPKSFPEERFDYVFGYKSENAKEPAMIDTAVKSVEEWGDSALLVTEKGDKVMDRYIGEIEDGLEGDVVVINRDNFGKGKEYQEVDQLIEAAKNHRLIIKYGPNEWFVMKDKLQEIAKIPGIVIVATPNAGRGLNLLPERDEKRIPLIVITDGLLSEWNAIQIAGRAYRAGAGGASFTFFSEEETQDETGETQVKVQQDGQLFEQGNEDIIAYQRETRVKKLEENLTALKDKYGPVKEFELGEPENIGELRRLIQILKKYNIDEKIDDIKTEVKKQWDDLKKENEQELKKMIENTMLLSQKQKTEWGKYVGSILSRNSDETISRVLNQGPGYFINQFLTAVESLNEMILDNLDSPGKTSQEIIDEANGLYEFNLIMLMIKQAYGKP
jgi:preprotein translocase subunit SecA